ncbi:MAG: glycoside hydrolase family 13 protein [Bacteroidales bacterium]
MKNMITRLAVILLMLMTHASLYAQIAQPKVARIEPPFWWTGMKDNTLQIMVYEKDISKTVPSITHPGVLLDSVIRTDNPNYLFLYCTIQDDAPSGSFQIIFHIDKKKKITVNYELKAREPGSANRPGIAQTDIVYMLMPDRFANGEPANDNMPDMLDKADRSNPDGRHGGDLKGIVNNVSYFNEKVGATVLWINPLLENNMPAYSYHGYATTNYYRVDPRFGTNEDYRQLSKELKKHNTKLMKDMVFNHCGSNHWWMRDLPTKTWVHQFPDFTRSNYRAETLMDPYSSESDLSEMLTGWFDTTMPDLNQQDPILARYLIQNSIWWIEYADLNGIRMDTWPYADATFLADWISAVNLEYPNFTILGETWLQKEAHTAWFQANALNTMNPSVNLKYLTDFPLHYAMNRAFREKDSWTGGVADLYYVLSQDFLYKKPDNLFVFLDNHDLMRFFTVQEKDPKRWEMGVTFLLTTRGIPVIYYGTEIQMEGDKGKGDADLRRDFPGGWPGDTMSAFTGYRLPAELLYAQKTMKNLADWRTSGFFQGNLIHYIPRDGVYVYFRKPDDLNPMMLIINNNDQEYSLDLNRFSKELGNSTGAFDIKAEQNVTLSSPLHIPPKTSLVLRIQ